MLVRPRRNRLTSQVRALVRETQLGPEQLVYPMFVQEGQGLRTPIGSMPGQARLSVDLLVETAARRSPWASRGVALFPALSDDVKDPRGAESTNSAGLLQRAVRALKSSGARPARDHRRGARSVFIRRPRRRADRRPQSTTTSPCRSWPKWPWPQARAGADIVAPSDMMDGRVGRDPPRPGRGRLHASRQLQLLREVRVRLLRPVPRSAGFCPARWRQKDVPDWTPANVREALREIRLDEAEGADWLMGQTGLPYADVIRYVREPHRATGRDLSRQRRVRDAQGRRSKRLARLRQIPSSRRCSACAERALTSSSRTPRWKPQSCSRSAPECRAPDSLERSREQGGSLTGGSLRPTG